MGHWGAEIFDNDIADEVKDEYIGKLKTNIGKSDEQILSEFLSENDDYITDDEDMIDFWFALSSVMHDYGRLTDEVKQKALDIIEKGLDAQRWEESREHKARLKQVEKLKTKLLSPLPKYRKVTVLKPWICPWKANDVFLYKFDDLNFSEISKLNHYEMCDALKYKNYEATFNEICKSYPYILLIVKDLLEVDWTTYGIYSLNPRTYLKLSNKVPNSLDDIDSAIFIPEAKCWKKASNEYRFLRLWSKRGFKSAQKLLSHLGNFPGYTSPDNEWDEAEDYTGQIAGGLDLLNHNIIRDTYWFILKS